MRFFFRSRRFKILIAVVAVIAAISIAVGIIGGMLTPQSGLLAAVTAPFEKLSADISAAVNDMSDRLADNEKAILKNSELEKELAELREKLADYDTLVRQNEFYANYLEIKEANADFQFEPADIIARDPDDPFGGFIINKGSLNGISAHDPIITDAGLVGYVTQVGLTTAKAATLLSPELKAGAIDSRTGDSGVISGSVDFAGDGLCRMYNLVRTSKVAVGDSVVTSGEGVFPSGLLIGEIKALGNDSNNTALYAAISPFADFSSLRSVMVLTYFAGQGSSPVNGDD